MDPEAPPNPSFSISSAADSLRRWIATLILYIELRWRLCAVEAKETAVHLLILALLLVATLVFFAGCFVMLIVFLLYLMMLIFHWDWGWSALVCAGMLLITSIVAGVVFRFQVVKPLFRTTFAEFQKDREWLTQTTRKNR
jgi:uncharacterized membrane protein YqjE